MIKLPEAQARGKIQSEDVKGYGGYYIIIPKFNLVEVEC